MMETLHPANETSKTPEAPANRVGRTLAARLDHYLAAPMWVVSALWLVFLAGGLQHLRGSITLPLGTHLYWWGILLLWPLYVLELAAHAVLGSPHLHYNVVYLFMPPLRLGARDHATWSRIWLPGAAWQHVDRQLVARVQKAISGPMVGFALLVLPLLALQMGWGTLIKDHEWLHFSVETTSSIIWLAFALELIVMLSIARRKTRYLIEHWIDLLIVLLPMVEAMPALRLATLGRLHYVGRLSRAYRTRGMAGRAFRAFLLLDSVQRLLRINPEKRLRSLREKLQDHYHEIESIRSEMRALEERIAADLADAPSEPLVAKRDVCE